MASDNCQKIKLLILYEMLRQETDEQHPMDGFDLISRLEEKGISCDRKTLSRDIRTLNDFGFEIMSRFAGHEKVYYVEDRSFSAPEIRILIDAVRSAGFITEKRSVELTEKIAGLGGSHRAELLRSSRVPFTSRKHTNESVYYNVDFLEDAILRHRKVSFRYFDLDENARRNYRRDGGAYIAEPLDLVCSEDNYYLICYSPKYSGSTYYRIDRMDDVRVLAEAISEESEEARSRVQEEVSSSVGMYSGQSTQLTLRFTNEALDAVFDRFGEDARIRRLNEDVCELRGEAVVSPTFWGWMFQFAGRMQIMEPESLREEYEHRARLILKRGTERETDSPADM
ncbi:MAG: WYL domain-containing protein [Eubacteriaceae bacterium]|nr:WYL domain-containing protein [Eubacteriaceae bacterium]